MALSALYQTPSTSSHLPSIMRKWEVGSNERLSFCIILFDTIEGVKQLTHGVGNISIMLATERQSFRGLCLVIIWQRLGVYKAPILVCGILTCLEQAQTRIFALHSDTRARVPISMLKGPEFDAGENESTTSLPHTMKSPSFLQETPSQ